MVATLASQVLAWGAVLATLVPGSFAFQYSKSEDGLVNVTNTHDIYSAQAKAMMNSNSTEDGEVGRHSKDLTSRHQSNGFLTGSWRHQGASWS